MNAGLRPLRDAAITSGIADLGSGAGRTATFTYVYRGPAINTDPNTPNPVSAADALTTVFDWFFANGGTDRPLRSNPSYPGVNRRIVRNADDAQRLGVQRWASPARSGAKGSYRVDGIYRDFRDFYTDSITPGVIVDRPGGPRVRPQPRRQHATSSSASTRRSRARSSTASPTT